MKDEKEEQKKEPQKTRSSKPEWEPDNGQIVVIRDIVTSAIRKKKRMTS